MPSRRTVDCTFVQVSEDLSSVLHQDMRLFISHIAVRRSLLVAGVCLITACSSGAADTSPATSVLVERPEAVRAAVVGAIAALGDGPVETRTSGSAGGQLIEIEAAADPAAMSMRLDETLNDTIRTQFVLVDEVVYARIYPIDQAEQPFAVSSSEALTLDFFDVALTGGGRLFGAVDTLAAVFDRVPATVFALGVRVGDSGQQTGYRFVFDAFDIGRLLGDEGFESSVLLPEQGAETTILEVWIDGGFRQLTTDGAVYHDGELIDEVQLTIVFTPVADADIEGPDNTLTR